MEKEESWKAFRVGCVGWSRTEKKYGSLSPGWEVISGPPLTAKVLGSTLSLLARTWGRGVGSCVRWRTALPVAVAVSSSASFLIRLIVPHHGRFRSGGAANQPFCGFYNPDRALVIFLFVCCFPRFTVETSWNWYLTPFIFSPGIKKLKKLRILTVAAAPVTCKC